MADETQAPDSGTLTTNTPPGQLDPNDPAAQAMIAGQGLFPIQTDPSAGLQPSAAPALSPPQTAPMTPSVGGEEAGMVQPSAGSETAGAAATPPPLPQAPEEPAAATTTTKTTTPADDDLNTIQNLQLEDIIDPQVVSELRRQALPQGGWQGIIGGIAKGLSYGEAEFAHPGSGVALQEADNAKQQHAMQTLTQLEGQLNMYKREALRQHSVQTRTESTQAGNLHKAQVQETGRQIRETLKQAQSLGVTPPIPPTADVIEKDPQSAMAWVDQANQLIEQKRMRNDIIQKQLPIFEHLAKDGSIAPDRIRAAFNDMLSSNGVSEVEKHQFYGSIGMMLEGNAVEASRNKNAYIQERNMRSANLGNMIKDRDARESRLSKALANGDMHAAFMEVKGVEQLRGNLERQMSQAQLTMAMAQAGEALQPGQPGYVPPGTSQNLQIHMAQLNTLHQNLQNLELYGSDHLTKSFNAQRPDVAISDATKEAQAELLKSWPAAVTASDLNAFIRANKSDPRVQAYHQSIVNRCLTTLGPNSGQLCADYIDQQRTKNSSKDALFGQFMQSSTAPNAATNAPAPGK